MAPSQWISARSLSALLPELGGLPGPRYAALSSAITGLLMDGRISPAVRLPSERELATALGISRATATASYQRLAEDGLLVRRRGSGSYLSLPAGARVTQPTGRLHRHGEAEPVFDLSVAAGPAVPGVIERAAAGALGQLSRYTASRGYHPHGLSGLRELIAQRFTDRGLATDAGQILITNGAQHAFDLITRLLLNSGNRVLTELPTYPGALEAIKAAQGQVLAVPYGVDGGWDLAAMRNTLQQASPRLAYLIPDFNNPTGLLIADPQRSALAAAARRAGTTVVVDESFLELDLRTPTPGLAMPLPMATHDRSVLTVGSLSKVVWGGLRIGWIRADASLVSQLAVVRTRSDMAGSVLDQLVGIEVFAELDAVAETRRRELRGKRDTLLNALAAQLPAWRPTPAPGGLSTWIELDAPGATGLTQLLERRGVLLTPGARFAADGGLERFLRIPFSLVEEELVEVVKRIATAWHELAPTHQPLRDVPVRVPA